MTLTVVFLHACMPDVSLANEPFNNNKIIVPNSQSISDVRSSMNLELHRNSLLPIPPNGLKVDDYYAVDWC